MLDLLGLLVNRVGEGGDLLEGVKVESLESLAHLLGQHLSVLVCPFLRAARSGPGKGAELFVHVVQVI